MSLRRIVLLGAADRQAGDTRGRAGARPLRPLACRTHTRASRSGRSATVIDAQGRLVDSHLGELTMASLRTALSRRFGQ